MKKTIMFLGMLGFGIFAHAQNTVTTTTTTPTTTTPTTDQTDGKVGINTDTPTRTLDINGDLRVRTIEEESQFGYLLMPSEATADGESNVVRKVKIKSKTFTAHHKQDILGGGTADYIANAIAPGQGHPKDGKITDGTWTYLKFGNKESELATVKESGYLGYIEIKESGFYQINTKVRFLSEDTGKTADNTYMNVRGQLVIYPRLVIGESSMAIYTGTKIGTASHMKGKTKTYEGVYSYDYEHAGRQWYMPISASGFFDKGDKVMVRVRVEGLPGFTGKDNYNKFKITKEDTTIDLIKTL